MGVPALFRWLSTRYPKVIRSVIEDEPTVVNGVEISASYSAPNRNGELDNLYLDMNGIVHPCTHPEGRPAPETENEMMYEVFQYTDRVVSMARPRKILMIAVDGVAPRAKMNQQRSRRFRSAQDAAAQIQIQEKQRLDDERRGKCIDNSIKQGKVWDSNVITPGTPFMDMLAQSLRYWIAYKLNNDPGWKNLKVILSDASVPGEGEHKIMEFIRAQRCDPEHDPNTKHCIYGLDADLIFLGLATHEPHFRILREDVFAQNKTNIVGKKKPFIWLDVSILRQYLEVELDVPYARVPFELERAIDDWVFLAFFCGNDFLPHLPSLDVRDNGIDVLLRAWRQALQKIDGYLTCDGEVYLDRVQVVLYYVARQEDGIFKKRHDDELRREASDRRRKMEAKRRKEERRSSKMNQIAPARGESAPLNPLESMLYSTKNEPSFESMSNREIFAHRNELDTGKRKLEEVVPEDDETAETEISDGNSGVSDNVRLWENGYHDRYFEMKFGVDVTRDELFLKKMVQHYIEGVCWVLKYYYQGCPSWTWYYPYHYAPFAQDMVDLSYVKVQFVESEPFSPLEQLMSVMPAASNHVLPKALRSLMTDADSPIIDFYPKDFPIDLNGKKMAWQGVALLPFIDETRLLTVVRAKYSALSPAELERNSKRKPVLVIAPENMLRVKFLQLYDEDAKIEKIHFKSWESDGLAGTALANANWLPGRSHPCPITTGDYFDIMMDASVVVTYELPANTHHKSLLLQGYKEDNLVISQEDYDIILQTRERSDRGDDRPVYRNRRRFCEEELYGSPRPLLEGGYLAFLANMARQTMGNTESADHGYDREYKGYQSQGQYRQQQDHFMKRPHDQGQYYHQNSSRQYNHDYGSSQRYRDSHTYRGYRGAANR